MDEINDKKVLVAMSGGLDSSVAAALLRKRGFSVAGAFMRFWSAPTDDEASEGFNRCCSPESESRARDVAERLGIPFYVIDLKDEFKKRVVDRFVEEYGKGRTPNPCVDCNEGVKLGLLIEKAEAMGFDLVATGHYAGISDGTMTRAKDRTKDQSYFLWKLRSDQVGRLLFPLAEYRKDEVRVMADEFGLPLSGIGESMEVCFIRGSLEEFLSERLGEEPGDVIDENGKTVGRHSGLWLHTIGQRKGLGLSGGPYYVIGKDRSRNVIMVSRDQTDLEGDRLELEDVNWISGEPSFPFRADVQIRYGHEASPATVDIDNGVVNVRFDNPQRAIAPGQSAVVYDGEKLVGGGVISRSG